MAKVTIGGVEYDLAPLKFKQLRQVAPFIDRVNGRIGDGTLVAGTDSAGDMLSVLAISIRAGGGPEVSAESLEDAATIADMQVLPEAFRELMEESGLAPKGEEKPAETAAPAEG